ncbi:MAG: hypothetical protein FWC79_05875 [Oscillospiraceae bacterium]|nr:hypothetical protein [Oscillospiraceae bacterium]
MKRTLVIIILIVIVIVSVIVGFIIDRNMRVDEARRHNSQLERYLDREILGTELASLINRVMDHNRRNNVERDSEGRFINNGTNSIRIDIEMITIEDTFSMEWIYDRGTTGFVHAFITIPFRSVEVEYHPETGKISRIVFLQLED